LEKDSSRDGYEIKDSRVPILLSLRRIESLRPHEETVAKELGLIINDLQHDGVLRHPLIADRSTGVVLDGTHRLAALNALSCRWVPCALVEYGDVRIKVEKWFRVITGLSLDAFLERLVKKTSRVVTNLMGEQCLSKRECYATLEDGKSCTVFPCRGFTPLELIKAAYGIEMVARENGLKVKYSDVKKTSTSSKSFVLSTVQLGKQEVVQSALNGVVFPPKTTRHVIPSRPLGISTPLEWLKESTPDDAQRRFVADLRSKRVTRLPEGSKVGSRRYLEEVFLFG
jgi:L-serine kinase (ADP)